MPIDLEIKNYRCYADNDPARIRISPGITAILGPNNSGKSALLRFFYELRGYFQMASVSENTVQFFSANKKNPQFALPQRDGDASDIFNIANERPLEIKLTWSRVDQTSVPSGAFCGITCQVDRTTQIIKWTQAALAESEKTRIVPREELGNIQISSAKFQCAEVCKAHSLLADSVYIGAGRNLINEGGGVQYDVVVGQSFVNHWAASKVGPKKSDQRIIINLQKELARLLRVSEIEISPTPDNKNLRIRIDGNQLRMDEVGSGLSHLLMVLTTVAIRRPQIVLVDEPELSLHPALQIEFLETIASYARYGVIMATHSYGLARAVATRVYTVKSNKGNCSSLREYERTPILSEFLGAMGYGCLADLGFDTVLLVEGPKDQLAMQPLLRLVDKDHRVVCLNLGGASLINGFSDVQLIEVKRIVQRVFALIDSERDAANGPLSLRISQFSELCAKVEIECHILERRALENYLPESAIREEKGEKYCALKPFEKLSTVSPSWSKDENWRIARHMKRDDLRETDLGKFLEKL